jgi:hypothetical protein
MVTVIQARRDPVFSPNEEVLSMTIPQLSRRSWCGACALFLVSTVVAGSAEPETLPPIERLKEITPKASVFEAVKGNDPLVVKSAEEAAKHFDEEALAALKKRVDFQKQIVLVFAWKGSGQDKLDYKVLESFPEQVVFELTPGRTKDLRSHTHVYVLRANVKWKR